MHVFTIVAVCAWSKTKTLPCNQNSCVFINGDKHLLWSDKTLNRVLISHVLTTQNLHDHLSCRWPLLKQGGCTKNTRDTTLQSYLVWAHKWCSKLLIWLAKHAWQVHSNQLPAQKQCKIVSSLAQQTYSLQSCLPDASTSDGPCVDKRPLCNHSRILAHVPNTSYASTSDGPCVHNRPLCNHFWLLADVWTIHMQAPQMDHVCTISIVLRHHSNTSHVGHGLPIQYMLAPSIDQVCTLRLGKITCVFLL